MLVHADNFAIYGGDPSYMLNGMYAQNAGCLLVNDPDGVSPNKVLKPNWDGASNSNTNWRYAFQGGGTAVVGCGLRMWNETLPTSNEFAAVPIDFRSIANTRVASVGVLSNGSIGIRLFQSNGTFVDYTTGIPAVTAQGWYHMEVRLQNTDPAGAENVVFDYEVRIEGQTVLEGSNFAVNYALAGVAGYWVQLGNRAQNYFIKDLVIWNETGTENTDFLGSVQVVNLITDGDVTLNWGVVGAATGAEVLSNIPADDDEYIYALNTPPPAGPYTGTLSDLPVDVSSVKGVITYVRAAKVDGGDGFLQNGLISDGVTVLGANRPITIAQTYWRDVFEVDPATGDPWLPTAVNDVVLQINRTV